MMQVVKWCTNLQAVWPSACAMYNYLTQSSRRDHCCADTVYYGVAWHGAVHAAAAHHATHAPETHACHTIRTQVPNSPSVKRRGHHQVTPWPRWFQCQHRTSNGASALCNVRTSFGGF